MKKRLISLIMVFSLLIASLSTAGAVSPAPVAASPISSSISICDSSGQVYNFDVSIIGDTVATTYTENTLTTVMQVNADTGSMCTKVYDHDQLISQAQTINESIVELQASSDILPYLVFPSTYQSIGSVKFKANSSGAAYNLSIKCKEESEAYNKRYNLNQHVTQSLQALVTGVLGFLNPFGFVGSSTIANYLIQKCLDGGVIALSDGAIAAVTSNYVTADITSYSLQVSHQYSSSIRTVPGAAVHFYAGGVDDVTYDEVYPQFLENRDTSVAALLYAYYNAYGFPGVSSFTATRHVPYYGE